MYHTIIPLFPDMPLALRVLAGSTEDLTPVGTVTPRETLNGNTVLLMPTYRQKWSVKISNSGNRIAPPMDVFQPGAEMDYFVAATWSQDLVAGQTSTVLLRDPAPGSVEVQDAITSQPLQFNVVGRTVTIGGRAGHTRVYYRPIFRVVVLGMSSMGATITGPSQTWSIDMRERSAS